MYSHDLSLNFSMYFFEMSGNDKTAGVQGWGYFDQELKFYKTKWNPAAQAMGINCLFDWHR